MDLFPRPRVLERCFHSGRLHGVSLSVSSGTRLMAARIGLLTHLAAEAPTVLASFCVARVSSFKPLSVLIGPGISTEALGLRHGFTGDQFGAVTIHRPPSVTSACFSKLAASVLPPLGAGVDDSLSLHGWMTRSPPSPAGEG